MSTNPLLLLEFNELCPALLDQFISEGRLPHFKQLREQSRAFITDAEEEGEKLNPWVQWVTVHTGLSASDHGVETLSEAEVVAGKNVWDVLSGASRKVLVCGSMNAGYVRPLNGYVLPDPWSTGIAPYPQEDFAGYFDFVRSAVQEHSNASAGISVRSARRFLGYMARHGLSFLTLWQTARQLISEKLGDTRWRRAAIMDSLQFDVFRHFWRTARPDFATFFLNSTAHFQHCYWRHWDPSAFAIKPPPDEIRTYSDAIPFGYRAMDALLGKLLRLVGPDCTVVFCTALSQEPYLKFEESGGRNYYRAHSAEVFKKQLGLEVSYTFEPVMAEQFYLRFQDEESANSAARLLESYRVSESGEEHTDDRLAFHIQRRGEAFLAQSTCTRVMPGSAVVYSAQSQRSVPFASVFYHMEALKSGRHHPDGAMWIRSVGLAPGVHSSKVPLRAVAPTLVRLFGLDPPAHMACSPLEGVVETCMASAVSG